MRIGEAQSTLQRASRSRLDYYRRLFAAYVMRGNSHLTFWHGVPQVNEEAVADSLGQYYMTFRQKASYEGPFDQQGIPLLDYRGKVGLQYNPIAIAQYGLGNYNLYRRTDDEEACQKFLLVARWLMDNLKPNPWGIPVWNHDFDWWYRDGLKAPWYSALAQGSGISMLLRAHLETNDSNFLEAAHQAFRSLDLEVGNGGVRNTDSDGHVWLEEAVVHPPSHILNGFLWAMWGVFDFILHTGDSRAKKLYEDCIDTLKANLHRFDVSFWSLYELSPMRIPMVASTFYHRLHIVQLRVMHHIEGCNMFLDYANKWQSYQERRANRGRALLYKGMFKLLHY